jgi:pimeloyl-ACP methyl ester carboxylesterase
VILKRIRRLLACRLALYSERGLAFLQCAAPLSSLAYVSAMPREVLVIFLPGIGDFAEDFESRGFIESLEQSELKADAIAVDAHYGYYARRSLHERLAEDVVLPARSRGYSQIWLVGISMGGIGAALVTSRYTERYRQPASCAGICLRHPSSPGFARATLRLLRWARRANRREKANARRARLTNAAFSSARGRADASNRPTAWQA